MEELVRTSDPVLVSAIEALLGSAGIDLCVADRHMASLEAMIGAFPMRILVDADMADRARRLLTEAGFGAALARAGRG